jgi:glutaryl-CoA dehydrogenase (non-decarboxylating)
MDFSLTQEHRMVQKMVREFAQKEVAPVIKESDRKQEMASWILPRMAELGILGICLPVRYGGQGMDYISLGLACEELEAVDSTLRVVMSVHVGLNSLGLFQWASEEQKQRFLVPQARGEKIACFGLTESGAGSDVAAMRSSARLDGDEYILNGEKMWISLATKADHVLWIGRSLQTEDPHDGLSAFLVELDRTGVSRGDIHGKLGVRAGSTGWIKTALAWRARDSRSPCPVWTMAVTLSLPARLGYCAPAWMPAWIMPASGRPLVGSSVSSSSFSRRLPTWYNLTSQRVYCI